MLLTITNTHAPATDLGYLLHKNPARAQSFELSFGQAHVFYPEASPERCVAALLLDVDPVGLVRGGSVTLQQYVNDRPYVASSFLSVAISRVFGTALSGKSKERPELAGTPLRLRIRISVLPSRGGEDLLRRLFEPLGYEVSAQRYPLDEKFPGWGESPYYTVELSAVVRLRDLLRHLYVLVPVLDDDKHYWVGDEEVEKLLRSGEEWLAGHPERSLISERYLKHQGRLTREALLRLMEDGEVENGGDLEEEAVEERISLGQQRLGAVVAALRSSGARRVLDLGCGEGKLLAALIKDKSFEEITGFLDRLVSHNVLDGGNLVVAHAGLKEAMQGRASGRVRDFALFGETTGETDEFGLPVRYDWATEYRGEAAVVYGHTPVPEAEWVNRTINIDTGCAFGGKLTALRYPEMELVSVPAKRTYYEPVKPFLPEGEAAPPITEKRPHDDILDIQDVLGKRVIPTRLHRNVTIREENAAAALEVMSRFAVDPRWLVYLPPTMSPSETSRQPGLLEHPAEAFAYYRHEGIPRVVCEEKHMGSRAVVVVCKDEDAARSRFGTSDGAGVVYTRTGRPFFREELQAGLLETLRRALEESGMWEEFETDWFCLDCEILPWSVKAEELLRRQYAAVGAASRPALSEAVAALEGAKERDLDVGQLLTDYRERHKAVESYVETYRRYCWPVHSLDDIKVAPFHLLATEGAVHVDKDHLWHLRQLARLCAAGDGLLLPTGNMTVDVTNAESVADGIRWWEEITRHGGEGMVVKPLDFVALGRRWPVQPGIKSRGREYLRIIYGPEYDLPENLDRLRGRRLSAKRSLASREFALGVEALERFVRREPLYKVHECVFGVLALESEPVDPRL